MSVTTPSKSASKRPVATFAKVSMDLAIRQVVSGILSSGSRQLTAPHREQNEEAYPIPSLLNE